MVDQVSAEEARRGLDAVAEGRRQVVAASRAMPYSSCALGAGWIVFLGVLLDHPTWTGAMPVFGVFSAAYVIATVVIERRRRVKPRPRMYGVTGWLAIAAVVLGALLLYTAILDLAARAVTFPFTLTAVVLSVYFTVSAVVLNRLLRWSMLRRAGKKAL